MADTNIQAYKKAKGEVPEQPSQDDNLKKLWMSYLTTPTSSEGVESPENVINQTAQGIKESKGVMPKILQGLGGVMRFANTGTGQNILNQALGGDRFSKESWLNSAQRAKEQEMAQKSAVAGQEATRLANIGTYVGKQQEIEANAPFKDLQAQQMGLEIEDLRAKPAVKAAEVKREQETMEQKAFEAEKDDIYQKNADLPGAEAIRQAKTREELDSIVSGIKKGFKVPFFGRIGAGVGTSTPTANPILDKYGLGGK